MEKDIRVIKNVMIFGLVILVLYLCKVLAPIVVPLLLAFFVALMLFPVLKYLRRHRVPGAVALPLTVIAPLPVVSVLIETIRVSVMRFYNNFDVLEGRFMAKMKIMNVDTTMLVQTFDELVNEINVPKVMSSIGSELTGFAGSSITVVLYLFFILAGLMNYKSYFKHLEGEENGQWAQAFEEVKISIAIYLRVKFLMSLILGVLVGVQCAVYNVEYPVFWGFICFIFNFIPNIGSIIASGACVFFSFLYLSPVSTLFFALIQITIQQIIGNVIEPIFVDNKLSISPLVILISLFIWGYIFGIVGALLSVPLVVLFKIVASRTDGLHTWAELITGHHD